MFSIKSPARFVTTAMWRQGIDEDSALHSVPSTLACLQRLSLGDCTMPNIAHIDLEQGQEPAPGEKFIISVQENSEMLGELDHGRTFRFTSPTKAERDYQQQNRTLTVVDFDPSKADYNAHRLTGYLTYTN
jgi:hypothetical protein